MEENLYKRLETKRLLLTEVEEKYAKVLWDNIYNDYEYYKYYTNIKIENDEEYVELVSSYKDLYEKGNHFRWLITSKEDTRPLGLIQLRSINKENKNCQIGWILMKKEQKQGFMLESAKTVIDFAFEELKLHRIGATISEENEKSLSLAKRLGMREEGFQREDYLIGSEYKNTYVFSLLETDKRP